METAVEADAWIAGGEELGQASIVRLSSRKALLAQGLNTHLLGGTTELTGEGTVGSKFKNKDVARLGVAGRRTSFNTSRGCKVSR
jgi:hypothetical protein